MRFYLLLIKIAKINKLVTAYSGEDVDKRNHSFIVFGSATYRNTMKINVVPLQKDRQQSTSKSRNSILG